MYYFAGLAANTTTRRQLVDYFRENYNVLYKRFEATFTMSYLVKYSFDFLSSTEDLHRTQEFFKDKDTAKYIQALNQTYDSIRSKAAYIDRSTEDLKKWLAAWESK